MDKDDVRITGVVLGTGADIVRNYAYGWTPPEGFIAGVFLADVNILISTILSNERFRR